MVWNSCDITGICNGNVWPTWTTTSAGTSDTTWDNWNDGCTTTSTSTPITATASNVTWGYWDNEIGEVVSVYPTKDIRELTKAEKQAEQRRKEEAKQRRIEQAARIKAREEEKKAAEQKAKDLLLDLIGKEQLEVYKETGRLFVKGEKFDYVVKKRGFVEKIEKNKVVDLCISLSNKFKYPETDNVIAMKLMIEDDEKEMLRLSNEMGSEVRPQHLKLAACM